MDITPVLHKHCNDEESKTEPCLQRPINSGVWNNNLKKIYFHDITTKSRNADAVIKLRRLSLFFFQIFTVFNDSFRDRVDKKRLCEWKWTVSHFRVDTTKPRIDIETSVVVIFNQVSKFPIVSAFLFGFYLFHVVQLYHFVNCPLMILIRVFLLLQVYST